MTEQTRTQWTADSILDFPHAHRDELRALDVVKIGLFAPTCAASSGQRATLISC